jgi:hypothetical protein
MSMFRTLAMLAALTAGPVACRDKPAGEAPTRPATSETPATAEPATAAKPATATATEPATADKLTADKPVADKPVAGKPAGGLVPEADAERFFGFIEQLVAVAVANQDDCAKMATAVNALVDANKALIKDAAEMQQQHKDLPPPLKNKMAKKFKDELGPAVTKKCSKNAAVQTAFQRIRAR